MDSDWFNAAECGDTQTILNLLNRGAHVDARNGLARTALMLAVVGRHAETVETLLQRGADVNARTPLGYTALTWAACQARGLPIHQGLPPDARLLERLLSAGGRPQLRDAILLGDVVLARRVCDADPSVDVNGEANVGLHWTYLMSAAALGPLDMVDFLLERGAEVDRGDEDDFTPLVVAAKAGHEDIVRRLLDRGADVNASWPYNSALKQAQGQGHQRVAALLLSRGARRHMSEAIGTDDLALAEELLDAGVGPDYTEYGGDPSVRHVMDAVARGNTEMVRLFLSRGASLEMLYSEEPPLLVEAASLGHVDVVSLLIAHGADVHSAGRDGRTPLHAASEGGHDAVVAELKRAGATR